VGAEVGGHPDGPGEQAGAAGPVVGVRIQQGRAVLAARVEHIAGARLHGDTEAERVQPVRDPAGAGGEVGGERVEVHVVEGQSDTVVAEVGEEGEGVVEPEVGETVGAVAEAEGGEGAGRDGGGVGRGSGPGGGVARAGCLDGGVGRGSGRVGSVGGGG
jgi:hypothetical protein